MWEATVRGDRNSRSAISALVSPRPAQPIHPGRPAGPVGNPARAEASPGAAYRHWSAPGDKTDGYGFRVARSLNWP